MNRFYVFTLFVLFPFLNVQCSESFDPAVDYYSVLGVPENAEHRDIRQAFKKLALTGHPDRNGQDKHAHMQNLNIAHSILGNPKTRERYDQARNPTPYLPVPSCINNLFMGAYRLFSSCRE